MEESIVTKLYQFIPNYTAYRHLYGHLYGHLSGHLILHSGRTTNSSQSDTLHILPSSSQNYLDTQNVLSQFSMLPQFNLE